MALKYKKVGNGLPAYDIKWKSQMILWSDLLLWIVQYYNTAILVYCKAGTLSAY